MACKVISLEGIWGVGKSTLSKRIARYLIRDGYRVSFAHYGKREGIGSILEQELDFTNPVRIKTGIGGFDKNYHAYIEILLRYARENYDQQIFFLPELAKNDILILDRGIDTITAYALATLISTFPDGTMSEYYQWIKETTDFWSCTTPELTIFLSLNWETAVQRAEERDKKDYGSERKLFLPKYVQAFEYIAEKEQRIKTIDINDHTKDWACEKAREIFYDYLKII
jgi:thymidylate kinase